MTSTHLVCGHAERRAAVEQALNEYAEAVGYARAEAREPRDLPYDGRRLEIACAKARATLLALFDAEHADAERWRAEYQALLKTFGAVACDSVEHGLKEDGDG